MAKLDNALLLWYLEELRADGWRVVSQTETTAQVERARKWNVRGLAIVGGLLVVGLIFMWMPLIVGALLGLIVVVVDYGMQKPSRASVTAQQAREAARLLEGEYQGE
jgi:hypothetical protein